MLSLCLKISTHRIHRYPPYIHWSIIILYHVHINIPVLGRNFSIFRATSRHRPILNIGLPRNLHCIAISFGQSIHEASQSDALGLMDVDGRGIWDHWLTLFVREMNPACCKMQILAKHGKTASSKSMWHRIFEETRFTYWGGSDSSSLVLATKHCQATLKSHLQLTCQALHTWDSSTRPCGGHVYLHALYQVILSQPNLENIRTHENLSKTYRAWKSPVEMTVSVLAAKF